LSEQIGNDPFLVLSGEPHLISAYWFSEQIGYDSDNCVEDDSEEDDSDNCVEDDTKFCARSRRAHTADKKFLLSPTKIF
jgi:hypothetical protein